MLMQIGKVESKLLNFMACGIRRKFYKAKVSQLVNERGTEK